MSDIRKQFTNIKGDRTEFGRITYKVDERHYLRESKSQKAQLESAHNHGTRKDVKVKMNHKLT